LERADANQQFEVLRRRVSERADACSTRVTPAPQIVDFQRDFERNRGRVFFGSFLLARQKKGTHRQVKSLLSELAAKAKMLLTIKDHQVSECLLLAQSDNSNELSKRSGEYKSRPNHLL
jgi:hypothetical protein